MILSTDQTGREIRLHAVPERIISLVPSQTELLSDLGLEEEVVGITKFCIHPDRWFRSKKRVGGTKNIDQAIIRELRPDLIIANKEENEKAQIESLASEFPVWTSSITNITEALDMIQSIADITGRSGKGEHMIKSINGRLNRLSVSLHPLKCLYLIWRDPYMAAGTDTFIHSTLRLIGISSVTDLKRYPEVTAEDITRLQPDLIFLSSEPYPFKEKHIHELQALAPNSKIMLVDGEMFSWYGSRMLYLPDYLRQLCTEIKMAL